MPTPSTPPRPVESFEDLQAAGLSGLLESIDEGLPVRLIGEIQEQLAVDPEEMASLLGISPRTLKRRGESGTLTPVESERLYRISERLYRIARLFRKSTSVFESEEEARSWLKRPQMRLGGEVPLEIARLEPGAREVERLLGRIEHGVPA